MFRKRYIDVNAQLPAITNNENREHEFECR